MRFVKLLFLTLLLVSCSANTTRSTEISSQKENATPQHSQPGYPPAATKAALGNNYPPPQSSNPTLPTQTIDPKRGMVTGVLFSNGEPVINVDLYLSIPVNNNNGTEVANSIDRTKSPRTKTNNNGEFTFVNIPDGRYGLVMDLVLDSYLLLNPKNGEQMRFDVVGGQKVDLGKLKYEDLPKVP